MRRVMYGILVNAAMLMSATGHAQILSQPASIITIDTAARNAEVDAKVDAAITRERERFSVLIEPSACPHSAAGEIVVCVHQYLEDQRVPSSIDDNPRSHEARRDGAFHPPNMSSLPDCSDPEEHCIRFGRTPAPIYYIDLSKIPLPPPGSDADKIAKGEMRAP